MIKYNDYIDFELYEELEEFIYSNKDIKRLILQRTKKGDSLLRFKVIKEGFDSRNAYYKLDKTSLKADEFEFLNNHISKELAIDWIIGYCKTKVIRESGRLEEEISKSEKKQKINGLIFDACQKIFKSSRFITAYRSEDRSDFSWGMVNALKICYGFDLNIEETMDFLESCGSYIDFKYFTAPKSIVLELLKEEEKELINRRIEEICCIYSVLGNKNGKRLNFDEYRDEFLKLLDIESTDELIKEDDKKIYRFLKLFVSYIKENSIKKKLRSFLDENGISHSSIYGYVNEPKDILYSKPDDTIMFDELLWLLYSIKHYETKNEKTNMIDAKEFIHSAGYSTERANLSYEEIALLYLLEHSEIEYKDAIDVISRFGMVFGDKEYKENREVHDINADSYKDYTNNDFYKDVEFEELSIKNDKFLKKEIEKNEKLPDGSGFLFFEIYDDKKPDSFIKDLYNVLKNDEFSIGKKPTFICRFEATKLLIFFKNISLSCLNKMEEASKTRFIELSLIIKKFHGIENIKSVYDELNKKPEMEKI